MRCGGPRASLMAGAGSPYQVGACTPLVLDASLSYNHGARRWQSVVWGQTAGPSAINEIAAANSVSATNANADALLLAIDPFNLFEGSYKARPDLRPNLETRRPSPRGGQGQGRATSAAHEDAVSPEGGRVWHLMFL